MNKDQAWDIQHKFERPSGWIQWKGTDVCVDLRCTCGCSFHYDGEFMYYVKCPNCGQNYFVNGHIQLIPIDESDGELEPLLAKPELGGYSVREIVAVFTEYGIDIPDILREDFYGDPEGEGDV